MLNKSKNLLAATVLATGLAAGCAGGPSAYRVTCSNELDAAWNELSIAEADGFAGTISHSKALTLITAARTQQTVENFDGCYKNAKKARFYIKESRSGR